MVRGAVVEISTWPATGPAGSAASRRGSDGGPRSAASETASSVARRRRPFEIVKRTTDIAASTLGLLLTFSLLAIVAVTIKPSSCSPGPVIFRQERMGRRCRRFPMLEFRTTYVGAHRSGPRVTAAGDARITPVGRVLRAS